MSTQDDTTARLLITCPDRPGIVAAVSNFLFHHGANVTQLDQHSTDPSGGTFFMRLEFQTPGLDISGTALQRAFGEVVARPFSMDWRMRFAANRLRAAILVSRHEHCFAEILWRWSQGELPLELPVVISNHPDLGPEARRFGLEFRHVDLSGTDRVQAGQRIQEALPENIDLLVLARYMQILSPELVAQFPQRIINIHHSFLPSFAGANPYRQAFDKGVKLIGATAHYVTAELDEGPIIEQDIARVSHRQSPDDMRLLGRELERQVLARALLWHAEDRIILHGTKTVVFV